jgi:serine-type D-Ala-D-Ala endopeptidase (penicillin-binding protein 7)
VRRPLLRIGRLGLALIGVGLLSIDAGAGTTTREDTAAPQPAPAAKTAPKPAAAKPAARRVVVSRARTRAREAADAKVPKFKLDANGEVVPDLRAAAAIIYSPESDQVLWEEHSQDERSIASITKVMTAIVVLENAPDLFDEVTIVRSDVRGAALTALRTGDKVKVWDLLHLLLIPSDNAAARALARVSPLGYDGFIARMNEKADEFGLEHTSYADPSGLLADNVSSAYDMARLISYAAEQSQIGAIMRTPEYSCRTVNARSRPITVRSTNQFVRAGDVDVLGGKTGFISKAGYCFATLVRLPQDGPLLAVVVLGARSNAGRFMETRHLMNWFSTKAQLLGLTPTP